jgi:hypothetical protein
LITIDQKAGIGDIFFCQKIAHKLIEEKNEDILWPVIKEFSWIDQYIKHPRIKFEIYDQNKKYINVLKLDGSEQDFPGSVMLAKYKKVKIDYSDWVNYFFFERNKEKEDYLYYNILGLKDDSSYIFVNRNYASPPNILKCNYIPNFKNEIEMSLIDNFTLFDWCKVFEKASEIHTVESSLNYIIEKLDINKNLNMYSKWNPPSYYHIEELFKKDWIYHG